MESIEDTLSGFQAARRNLVRASVLMASAGVLVAFGIIAKMSSSAGNENDANEGGDGNGNGKGNGKGNGQGYSHCFLRGTAIKTVSGSRNIEDLAVGDLLPTVFGGASPVQWIGRYKFKKADRSKPWVEDVLPIRIARSALSRDIPQADLYVTKTHALLVDGVLVAAGNLVNGSTITRHDARELDELEFFHIKLAHHDVIYAEGAPCETLLRVDENAVNFAQYLRECGRSPIEEIPCAPLLRYSYRRDRIKSCFRSAISPWIERRHAVDIIRDKLDARGIALSRQRELAS